MLLGLVLYYQSQPLGGDFPLALTVYGPLLSQKNSRILTAIFSEIGLQS